MEKFQGKYYLYICKKCKAIGGENFVIWRWHESSAVRCILCRRIMAPFHPKQMDQDVVFKKGGKKFPRLLATNPEQQKVADMITERCKDLDCPGKIVDVQQGPIVTEYQFAPDQFTRIRKVRGINEDLAIALSVENVSFARTPGKPCLSVYVPNKERKDVPFEDTLKNIIVHRDDMALPMNLGVTSNGEPYVEDLAKLPHLLIAGSTGAGKSTLLHSLILSLLYIRSPKQMRFLMIDPKSVELFKYNDLPHMMLPAVNSVWRAMEVLDTVVQEMRRRMSNLQSFNCRDIAEYNEKVAQEAEILRKAGNTNEADRRADDTWPRIVVVIDEIADFMLQEKKLFTEKLAEIAQMSRAAGIHVIAATQRPSVDVLNGKIKVNFPARVAFKVPSTPDSRTILHTKGAETLLGYGDIFYMTPVRPGLQRLHSAHAKAADIEKLKKLSLDLGHIRRVPADGPEPTAVIVTEGKKTNGKPLPKTMVN